MYSIYIERNKLLGIKQLEQEKKRYPKLIINKQNKKINNNLRVSSNHIENKYINFDKKGATLEYYPTNKEKLKKYFNKFNNSNSKQNQNIFFSRNHNKLYINNNSNNNNSFIYASNNNENKLFKKSKTQIYSYEKSQRPFSKLNIRSFNNISNLIESTTNRKDIINNIIYKPNYKYFSPISKKDNTINIKIRYKSLINLSKIKPKKKQNKKIYFKGPKYIYDLFNLNNILKIKKLEKNTDIKNKQKKDEEKIDKKNEYKYNINELMEGEQENKNIINNPNFSNIIRNNKYLKNVGCQSDGLAIKKDTNENTNNLQKIAFKGLLKGKKYDDENKKSKNDINNNKRIPKVN